MKQATQSFHNTIDLFSVVLEQADESSKLQDDIIWNLFKSKPLPKTAEEVMRLLPNMHPSSVRRALSNLSNPRKLRGAVLVKTEKMKMGGFGKPVHHWKLNEQTN